MEYNEESESSETETDFIEPKAVDDSKDELKEQEDEIAGAQIRRAVNCSRALILSVLACSTLGVAFVCAVSCLRDVSQRVATRLAEVFPYRATQATYLFVCQWRANKIGHKQKAF